MQGSKRDFGSHIASHGPDLDPGTHIFSRRALAFRRYIARDPRNARKMREIFEAYRKRGEPRVHKDDEQLMHKKTGGDPATAVSAVVRNECNPQGQCGYLLESIHLQSASLDEHCRILQWNQQGVDLIDGPYQQVIPLTSRVAARNRTRRVEGTILETENLNEIDTYATNAKHNNEGKNDTDQLVIRTIQTGSNWSNTITYHTYLCGM